MASASVRVTLARADQQQRTAVLVLDDPSRASIADLKRKMKSKLKFNAEQIIEKESGTVVTGANLVGLLQNGATFLGLPRGAQAPAEQPLQQQKGRAAKKPRGPAAAVGASRAFIDPNGSAIDTFMKEHDATFFEIDGSLLEGGGQILRQGAALSCLLAQPVVFHRIRAGRKVPGLRAQHLSGLELSAELTEASLLGGSVKSCRVAIAPGEFSTRAAFVADTRTAGSTMLLLQVALPILLFRAEPATVVLRGGTNAIKAPPTDYIEHVLAPTLASHFGATFSLRTARRGWFPRGGGEVTLTTEPVSATLRAISLTERGHVTRIFGHVVASGKLRPESERLLRLAQGAVSRRMRKASLPDARDREATVELVDQRVTDQTSPGSGATVVLFAETSTGCLFGGTGLKDRGMGLEDVADQAADELLAGLEHSGCVDEYLADQLIIFAALAAGKSTIRCGPLSLHAQTAIHFAEAITAHACQQGKIARPARITVTPAADLVGAQTKACIVEVEGVGYVSRAAR